MRMYVGSSLWIEEGEAVASRKTFHLENLKNFVVAFLAVA